MDTANAKKKPARSGVKPIWIILLLLGLACAIGLPILLGEGDNSEAEPSDPVTAQDVAYDQVLWPLFKRVLDAQRNVSVTAVLLEEYRVLPEDALDFAADSAEYQRQMIDFFEGLDDDKETETAAAYRTLMMEYMNSAAGIAEMLSVCAEDPAEANFTALTEASAALNGLLIRIRDARLIYLTENNVSEESLASVAEEMDKTMRIVYD